MADDYSINAKITADSSGFKSGVNDAIKSSKKLSSTISNAIKGFGKNGLVGALGSVGLALGGVGIALGVAKKAFQAVSKAVAECTEEYKKSHIAEQQLRQAISNSPYVTGESTKALLDFASAIQKTSNYGDDELLPFMTKLISSGRSEAETMKIMQTAVDMSATGVMDLNTAVTQLNATMNGNVGRLGQQNAELKALSTEELEAGKAVDILSEKFKGQSELSIDTSKQLKNAWGDLKETFGKTFEKALSPMRKFFAELIQGWADARKAKQEYDEAVKAVDDGNATIEQIQLIIEKRQEDLEVLKNELVLLEESKKEWEELEPEGPWAYNVENEIALQKERIKQSERELAVLNAQLSNKKRQEEADNKAKQEAQALADAESKKIDLNKKYTDAITEQEAKWKNIEAVTGNAVALDEKRNFYQDQLVGMLTESNGELGKGTDLYDEQVTKLNEINKKLLSEEADEKRKKQIEAETKAIEELDKQLFEKRLSLYDKDSEEYHNLVLKKIEMAKEEELETALTEEQKLKIQDKYFLEVIEENKRYREAQKKENGKEVEDNKKKFSQMLDNAKKYFTALKNVISGIASGIAKVFSKLFDINLDDLMDNVLKFEDKILTFFVETLPKLPEKLKSILGSVGVLLDTLLSSPEIDGFLEDMFEAITTNLPALLRKGVKFITKVAKSLISALSKWIKSGGARELIETALDIIQDLFKFLVDNLPTIIDMTIKLIADIVAGVIARLPEIVVMILKAIPSIIKSLLQGIWELIKSAWKGIIGGLGKVWNWIKEKITGHAIGTNAAQRGLALVGEKGPELVNFGGGEKVYNNTNTTKILQNAGGGSVFNVTFENTVDTTAYAMMKQLKGYQRSLAFNGII